MTLHVPISKAQELMLDYQSIRSQSIKICEPLEPEDYVVQPILDVSPPKWHLGHSTWFFENFVLVPNLKDYQAFDLKLNYFFNSYYESQGPRILRSNRGNITRPGLKVILDYRNYVDQHIARYLEEFGDRELPKEIFDLIILGLQHEQQHQELLLTDIKYILGNNPLFPVFRENKADQKNNGTSPLNFLEVGEGIYEIGHQGKGFCFDNELGVHKVFLHDFQIMDRLVTNGEYLEFVNDGAYDKYQYWLSEGWEWLKQLEVKAPLYWFRKEGEWWQFTLNGLSPIDLNSPVSHVSYFEADAFAQWKEMRLATEFEWETAAKLYSPDITNDQNFVESNNYHPIATQHSKDYQFLGNTWEWTSSAYLPYPNYPRLKGALGEYNGKFMVNQMVLRGGSCATPRSHIRHSYRNFFHADKRWQFTGIRLVK